MYRSLWAALVVVIAAVSASAGDVSIDGVTSKTPKGWVEETPSNKMRFAQFRLPKAKDDKEDAELIVFKGLGGGAEPNIKRWKGQFIPPAGKKIEDVAKVEKVTIAGKEGQQLTIAGTYKYNPAPFAAKSKEELRPGYKMIAIYFDGPEDVYQIKLTGPAKTVDQHAKAFEGWVKGFKK